LPEELVSDPVRLAALQEEGKDVAKPYYEFIEETSDQEE